MTVRGIIHDGRAVVSTYRMCGDDERLLALRLEAALDVIERQRDAISEWAAAFEEENEAPRDFMKPETKAAVRRLAAAEEELFKIADEAKEDAHGQADEDS